MKNRTLSAAKQKGFSLLTGFILVIIMFGSLAFFLAGQGINTGFGATYTNTAKVSSLLTSAGYINTGFDAVTLNGISPSAVTFDATATTGIFNPTSGGASVQSVDPTILVRNLPIDGYWVYRGGAVTMYNVGVALNADYTIMLSGLKKGICQQINNTLHGTALSATPPPAGTSPYADSDVIGTPTSTTPASNAVFTVAATAAASGWLSGCYATTTGVGTDVNYVYIHTLLAQ